MRVKNFSLLVAGLMLLGTYGGFANADVAIVVHPSFPSDTLSKADLVRLYLGRTTSFPSGTPANPIDFVSGPVRSEMLSKYLEKTETEMAHIWSRLVFSGSAKSLPKVADDKAMLERVANDPTAIGYVDPKSVNASVKVLAIK